MRRIRAVMLFATGIVALGVLVGLQTRARSGCLELVVVAAATAAGCGALSLPLLRPMLARSSRRLHEIVAAALLPSATLALVAPLLLVLTSPTFSDALLPARLPATIGAILGAAVAWPRVVSTWRHVEEREWRPLAWSALAMGVLLAPGGDLWFPVLGIVALQALAFALAAALAYERDADVLPP